MPRLALLVLLLAACTKHEGDNGDVDLAVAEVDLAVAPPDLSPPPPDLTPPPTMMIAKLGVLNVASRILYGDGGVMGASSASMSFSDYSGVDMGVCVRDRLGPCDRTICPPSVRSESGGTITIAGGVSTQTLEYSGGNYQSFNVGSLFWPAGSNLTVSAAGATVPAWSSTLVMPAQPTITAPALPNAGMVIPRNTDLNVVWQGGTRAVSLVFSQPSSTSLRCDFDAALGAGTIPAAALSGVPAGSYSLTGYAIDRKVIAVDEWQISLVALASAADDTGDYYSGQVELQ